MKKITIFIFALALFLGMLTLSLRELRNWRIPGINEPTISVVVDENVVPTNISPAEIPEKVSLYDSRETAITRGIADVSPAVVGISTTQIRYSQSPLMADPFWRFMMPGTPRWFQEKNAVIGSGFIYDEDGYIITNAHVVENAVDITVTMADGSSRSAEAVGIDEKTDLAIIKIIEPGKYQAAALGNSDDIIMGEWVIALGNPFGLFSESKMPIATAGIISSLHMDFGFQQPGRIYQDMIQTDASINSGNSGGPLVNSAGQVVGINTFIFSGGNNSGSIGIGFALPINRAIGIIDELRSKGFIDRNYSTGISYRPNNPRTAQLLNLGSDVGVVVVGVKDGSPAHRGGIEVGDLIVGLDGQRIQTDDDIFTYFNLQDLKNGDQLTLNVLRQKDSMAIPIILGETVVPSE
ncbi:MAG: trypsin-like serine protease [Candidatus Marinimicrobia bacterium]|jgi:serine protease Do|nr:trypsin-like serine protease [Candidatus Neomarinimicrobiota bacterium]MBT3630837.1 trypsin-like serine protease [Candidatus Neomarinimicrobiota bacterium]MBT3825211.1 trypsin-like serine protease [Candidatus Neomarinimicrobiota bacterium]MBT4132557.1 trypsin-like serine protease [Candidatus Neomarinimicrobiota bacterium]MBT4296438.1 trypsin-like serine protease [Candidatus Neomarinimicrobiota bacterium]